MQKSRAKQLEDAGSKGSPAAEEPAGEAPEAPKAPEAGAAATAAAAEGPEAEGLSLSLAVGAWMFPKDLGSQLTVNHQPQYRF